MGFQEFWNGAKQVTSDFYNGGKVVGRDTLGGVGRVAEWTGEKVVWVGNKVGTIYKASAREVYEHGRLKLFHTADHPVFFDGGWFDLQVNKRLVSVAVPARIGGEFWRAPRTSKVFDLWGSNYPAVLLELEDPDPKLDGEEAIRLTAHGMAQNALGSTDVAWRMWMPGRFQIKVDANGTIIEKPQAEMTAGDVVSLLADEVKSQSGGNLIIAHRDLHAALINISKKSHALEKRWSILNERLKFNKNLVNKPEKVAGALLSMVLLDTFRAEKFVNALLDGTVVGWKSCVDQLQNAGNFRVYGSFVGLLEEGQRMLPRPVDPSGSFRVPARVLVGSYEVLQYINEVVDTDDLISPVVKELATLTKQNQVKALSIGKAVLLARGQGFDEIRKRIEAATPKLVGQMGVKANEVMAQLGDQMSEQVDASNFTKLNPPGNSNNNTNKTP